MFRFICKQFWEPNANLLHNEGRTQLLQDPLLGVDMLLLLSIYYVLLPYALHSKSNILIFHFNLCKKRKIPQHSLIRKD